MLSGTMSRGELCQPAPARIRRAMALTQWLISAKCWFMASLLTGGMTRPAPRAGQSSTSSDGADEASLRRPSQQASPAGTFGRLRPSEPPIAFDPRPRAALGPDAGQRAVAFQPGRNAPRGPGREALWNGAWRVHPETRFRPAGKLPWDCGTRQLGEAFLIAACASRLLWPDGNRQTAPRLLGLRRARRLRPQLRNTQILAGNLVCRHAVWESPRSQIFGWLV
jgi:hypothetical protein